MDVRFLVQQALTTLERIATDNRSTATELGIAEEYLRQALRNMEPIATRPLRCGAPEDYWRFHHPNCGTLFRGCDPENCPQRVYQETGVWYDELVDAAQREVYRRNGEPLP